MPKCWQTGNGSAMGTLYISIKCSKVYIVFPRKVHIIWTLAVAEPLVIGLHGSK